MRIIQLVLLSMILTACASIPLKTVYNLWNFDPWTSEFRQWRAAVRVPQSAEFDVSKARVQLDIETWRDGDTTRAKQTFFLTRSQSPEDLLPLKVEARTGFVLGAYRFDPNDYPRLQSVRAKALAARQTSGPKLHGSLSIKVNMCDGLPNVTPVGGFPLSTYLLVDAKDGYNPLLIDYDLGPDLRKSLRENSTDEACKTPSP